MRLTKMKAATAIAVALGLIGTGAGVVAQGPFPPRKMTDDERFQQVEQKLDRVLQALERSAKATTVHVQDEHSRGGATSPSRDSAKAATVHVQDEPVMNNRTESGFTTTTLGRTEARVENRTPALVPSPNPSVAGNPDQPPAAFPPPTPVIGSGKESMAEVNPGNRLNRLERRLDDIEKRLTRLEQKPNPTMLEPIPTESAPQADRFFRTRGGIGSDPQTSATKRNR